MSHETSPLNTFLDWLPGELAYSAKKAGYDKKIERARLPNDDPRGMYGFLSQEWHTHQLMRQAGNHHADSHKKTAQLQLAKFTAGLFDKAAIARWMAHGFEPGEDAFLKHAEFVGEYVKEYDPGGPAFIGFNPSEELSKPFEKTLFAGGFQGIMQRIVKIVDTQDAPNNTGRMTDLYPYAISYGRSAVQCYLSYAEHDLRPDQYALATSELAA